MSSLELRTVYAIRSRNLLVGVFVAESKRANMDWFIGIREKFGSHFLFTELGWNAVEIGKVPEGIEISGLSSELMAFMVEQEKLLAPEPFVYARPTDVGVDVWVWQVSCGRQILHRGEAIDRDAAESAAAEFISNREQAGPSPGSST